MRWTQRASDGVELAVVEFGGAGRPVLLLHGLMGRATTWWSTAQWLVEHGRVLSYDARGHGRSQAAGPWTTDRMVEDAAAVLSAVGPGLVVGHSMGGLHGLVLAARHPELVTALVVEDMAVDFRGRSAADARAWFGALPSAFSSLAAVRAAFGWPRREFGEYMAECVEERADGYHLLAEVEHVVEIAAEWADVDHWATLDEVRCPVLLVEGAESVAPPGQMTEMARRLPAARHVLVDGAGHLVHDGNPTAFREAVDRFVRTGL
ncbi:alpha/beta fold hydrolase [Pseudonocardia sp. TRM90224]|uniref:alpha/beta fold hydrolase n=1 Tax=Pseudonocardia sp. TRM90224 TaxID=2812678 RepID=UPI001E4F2B2A|nr:alpha/beta hydrolase [Pseudonocardia sp. TRM90224]